MLDKTLLIAKKDTKLLIQDKSFLIILAIFITMSIISFYISYSTNHTIMNIYNTTALELKALNQPVPSIPFKQEPLGIMKNMIIYIVLIGSLLAIAIGHIIGINDRKAAVTRVLFAKPFSKFEFFIGKSIASLGVLFCAIFFSFVVSAISLSLVNVFSLLNLLYIFEFYAVSFIYLAGFVYLGLFFAIKTDNSTKAILIPILIWIVIAFALPQMSLALYPTSSLNPILPETNLINSPILSTLHSFVYPFSISEQYKELSSEILGFTINQPSNIAKYSSFLHLVILSIWMLVISFLSLKSTKNYDAVKGDSYE